MTPRRTIQRRLLRLIAAVLSLVALSLLSLVVWTNLQAQKRRLAEIESEVHASIARKANVLVGNQALALRGLVADNGFTAVQDMIQTTVKSDPEIVYGTFVSSRGEPWAYASPSTHGLAPDKALDRWKELGLSKDLWQSRAPNDVTSNRFGEDVLEVTRPVVDEGETLGVIQYGFSTAPLRNALAGARAESQATLRSTLGWLTLAVVLCTVVGVLLMSRAASRIVGPLKALTDATARIAKGEAGVRVAVSSDDELGALAAAFNQMQQATEDAMERLNTAMEAALEASRLKSEFLANMSHEIRTPMNGVIGMIRLILKMPMDGRMRRYAETVDASASALMTIINDVLDFSKMEAGKYTLQHVPYDPGLVLQEVAELLSGRAQDKQLELVYQRGTDVPAMVTGDPDRYRQVLNNLIGNAIKFSEQGEVYVELSLDATVEDGYMLRTVVHDAGIGIAEEDQVRLFGAFSQVDGSLVRKHGGTGLGLAISKRLVEMMGGEIGVVSEKGVGSRFWFTIKVAPSDAPTRRRLAAVPTGRRAVVVEGSRRWCRIIEEHLIAWGLRCDVFQDGKPALKHIAKLAPSERYDVAVVGAQLRDITIEQFMKNLRSQAMGRKVPVIALTQLGTGATLTEVEHEVAAQITKPLRLSELYDCIVGTFAGTSLPAPKPRAQERQVQNRGKTILVVDDSEINQFVAREQLLGSGFNVDCAANGLEALEKVQKNTYAAVLMDCQMPVMDGYTATRKIREWEDGQRHITIIALTAHAMAGERDKVLAAGMDDYLSKPLQSNALDRMLERHLGGERPSAQRVSVEVVAEKAAPQGTAAGDSERPLLTSAPRSPKLVSLFIALAPENLQELDGALTDRDPQRGRDLAHKLKGSCLAIGAELMAREAELLQGELGAGEMSHAEERTQRLWSYYDRVAVMLASADLTPASGVEAASPSVHP